MATETAIEFIAEITTIFFLTMFCGWSNEGQLSARVFISLFNHMISSLLNHTETIEVSFLPLFTVSSLLRIQEWFNRCTKTGQEYRFLRIVMLLIHVLQKFPVFEKATLKFLGFLWTTSWIFRSTLQEFEIHKVQWPTGLVILASLSRLFMKFFISKHYNTYFVKDTDLNNLLEELNFLCSISPVIFLPLGSPMLNDHYFGLGILLTSICSLLTGIAARPYLEMTIYRLSLIYIVFTAAGMFIFSSPEFVLVCRKHIHEFFSSYIKLLFFIGCSFIYCIWIFLTTSKVVGHYQHCQVWNRRYQPLNTSKKFITLSRKFLHIVLFACILVIQRKEEFLFTFERQVFPIGISFLVFIEVYIRSSVKNTGLLYRMESCFTKPNESPFMRSHLYLLLGSILPSLFLGSILAYRPHKVDVKSNILTRLFSFSGFVYVGVTDTSAAVGGIFFGLTKIGLRSPKSSSKTWEGAFVAYICTFFAFWYALSEMYTRMPDRDCLNGREIIEFSCFFHLLGLSCAVCEFCLNLDDNLLLPVCMTVLWSLYQRSCITIR